MNANNSITEDQIMQIKSTDLSNLCKMILWYLLPRQGSPVSLSRIAYALGTVRQSIAPLVGELEQDGYITIDKSQRVGNMYFLTDKIKD